MSMVYSIYIYFLRFINLIYYIYSQSFEFLYPLSGTAILLTFIMFLRLCLQTIFLCKNNVTERITLKCRKHYSPLYYHCNSLAKWIKIYFKPSRWLSHIMHDIYFKNTIESFWRQLLYSGRNYFTKSFFTQAFARCTLQFSSLPFTESIRF